MACGGGNFNKATVSVISETSFSQKPYDKFTKRQSLQHTRQFLVEPAPESSSDKKSFIPVNQSAKCHKMSTGGISTKIHRLISKTNSEPNMLKSVLTDSGHDNIAMSPVTSPVEKFQAKTSRVTKPYFHIT